MNHHFNMRLGFIWFLFGLLTVTSLQASPSDTLLAHEDFETGMEMRANKQFAASIPYLIQARDGFVAAAQNEQDYCWERAIKATGGAIGSLLMVEQFKTGDSLARNSIAAFPEGVLKQSKQTRGLYGNWARCCYYLQRFEQAVGLFEDLYVMERQRVPLDSNVIQRVLTDITYSYRFAGNLSKAIEFNHIALDWAKNRADTSNIAILYRSRAGYLSYFGEREKPDSLFRLAVEILEAQSFPDTRELMMAHADYSVSLLRQGYMQEALVYAKQSLKEAEESSGTLHRDYAASLNNTALCYMALRDFRLAKRYLLESLDVYLQTVGENFTRVSDIYVRLSKIHFAQLEYEVGLEYQEKAVKIRENVLGPNNPYTVNQFGNLGWAYLMMGRFEESVAVYEKTIEQALRFDPVNEYSVAFMENNLAQSYQYLERFEEANLYFERAIQRKKAIFEPTHTQISTSILNHAKLFLDQEDYPQAKTLIEEGIAITASALAYDSIYHAEALMLGGRWAYETKNYQQGIEYLQTANSLLQSQRLVVRFERLELLELEVKTLMAQGELQAAWQKIALADQDIEHILPRLQEREGRLKLKKIAHFLYLKGVAICYDLYQESQEQSWLEQAFQYAESAKAAILFQEMHELALAQNGLIPQEIAQLESDIRSRDQFLQNQLLELKNAKEIDQAEVARIKSDLLRTQVQSDSFFSVLENKYPQYYQLRVKTTRLDLAFIQSRLAANQSLLAYLVDEDQVWVFVIDADKVALVPLRGTLNLANQVDQLRGALSATKQGVASHQNYLTAANELYKLLVKPIESTLKSAVIIIPDDILSYLPFECLLSQPGDPQQAMHQLAFWLNDKTISYAYSASLWAQNRNKRRLAPKRLLAVAPMFQAQQTQYVFNRGDYLGPLMASRSEAQSVAQIWQGETLLDSMASIQNFATVAAQYQIIHLATHGKILDDEAGRSFLAFYGQEDTLRLGERVYPQVKALYLADLFSLRLQSDLVVLSACETGLGKLYKGEGVASLARGFTYAGAGSILNTLWSVSDEGSKILMERFYYHLNQSQSRAAALRLAKLDLIQSKPELSKPFYWAGYILVGDEREIVPQNEGQGILYVLILIGFALLAGMTWQMKQQKTAD